MSGKKTDQWPGQPTKSHTDKPVDVAAGINLAAIHLRTATQAAKELGETFSEAPSALTAACEGASNTVAAFAPTVTEGAGAVADTAKIAAAGTAKIAADNGEACINAIGDCCIIA